MAGLKPQLFRVIENNRLAEDQSEPATEQVGAFLHEARQNTGRSLAEIASTLRIRAKFLQAIEDGRYEDLPGPTYAVGFIRSYADYLGLDSAALLAQFKTESNGVETQPDLEFPVPSTVGWFPTGKVVASCAVLAAAIFGGWFYLQTKDAMDVAAVPPPPGSTPAIAVSATSAQAAEAKVVVAAAAEPARPAAPDDDATDATADIEADNREASVDQAALETAQPAGTVADTPPATDGETASNDGEQARQQPVPITAPAATDPVATEPEQQQPDPVASESDQQQPEPAVAAGEVPAPAAVATTVAAAEVSAPVAVIEPAKVAEAPEVNADELTPVSASVAEPTPPAAQPRVAAPPPAAPAAPEPVVQVASLPAIPADGGNAGSSDDGRTYGVINQEARVVIGARADSWVQVLDGNQNVLLTRMLRTGDRYMVPNRNDLVMLTGNAGGLIISVDGEKVPQIGSDGAILHNVRLDVELLKSGRAVIQ